MKLIDYLESELIQDSFVQFCLGKMGANKLITILINESKKITDEEFIKRRAEYAEWIKSFFNYRNQIIVDTSVTFLNNIFDFANGADIKERGEAVRKNIITNIQDKLA